MAEIAIQILERLEAQVVQLPPSTRRSYAYSDGFKFHFLFDLPRVFVCMEREMGSAGVFVLLSKVRQRTEGMWIGGGDFASCQPTLELLVLRAIEAAPRGMTGSFKASQDEARLGLTCDQEVQELQKVQVRLEATRSVMAENIEQVIERGLKIEVLVDKTEHLHAHAFKFARASKAVGRSMRWRMLKARLLKLAVAAAACFLFASLACGGVSFSGCRAARLDAEAPRTVAVGAPSASDALSRSLSEGAPTGLQVSDGWFKWKPVI